MPETAAAPHQCPHCKIIDPMSGVYCIHCGLLMSSQGVTGEKATPGAAAVAGAETMLHCPNCGGGNSRENSVCGWCDAVLPWATENVEATNAEATNAEAANAAPDAGAAPLSAPAAAAVVPAAPAPAAAAPTAPTPAAAVPAAPAVVPSVVSTYVPPVAPEPQQVGVPAPAPVIDESLLHTPHVKRPRAWVLFVSLTGFAVFATLIVWSATRKPATTVVTGGAPATVVQQSPSGDGSAPAPDVEVATQAANDAQAELEEKSDAAQKAAAEASAAARRAAEAKKQLDAAKAQGPKDAAALAAAQDKARQAQDEAEDAQAKARAAQAATDAANARADQAARDAAAAVAQAKAAENAAAQPPTADATPAPAAGEPASRLSVRFLKSGDSQKLRPQGNTASVDMRVEAVVTSSTGENISRAYVRNVGRKSGLVSQVYYDVRGPNEELVSTRRAVNLRWDGGISMQYTKAVEASSPSDVAALLPAGIYVFRVYRNANDTVSMGQYEFTLTN